MISYGLTCSPPVASMSTQDIYKLQPFTGLGKVFRFCPRDMDCGRHTFAWISLDAAHIEPWRCWHRSGAGDIPQACWKDFESTMTSRNCSTTKGNIKDQSRSLCKTLEQSSPECCSGLKEAARYACNDAKIVNARAREGFVLLARGFERLDRRARKDVALLGLQFLKLDARARQDTEKLDTDARRNADRLRSMAVGLTDKAQIRLKRAAEKHWSDGALDADLRLADLRAKRRAMEDAFISLQLVKSIHNGMAKSAYKRQREIDKLDNFPQESVLEDEDSGRLKFSGNFMYERLAALQEAYWDIASALAEADGIDYTDPDELELIIAALLDMDAVDGASSATMLAECANSPDVATRQALANALGNAPSVWALGNAGMGALQRLASDSNPAVAAAASKALDELKKQWQMDTNDSLIFRVDSTLLESLYPTDDDNDEHNDKDNNE